MTGIVIIALVVVAVVGVLVKVSLDTLEIVREERREHGRVSSYGVLRIAVIAGIVLIILFWLLLGFIAGDNTPVY